MRQSKIGSANKGLIKPVRVMSIMTLISLLVGNGCMFRDYPSFDLKVVVFEPVNKDNGNKLPDWLKEICLPIQISNKLVLEAKPTLIRSKKELRLDRETFYESRGCVQKLVSPTKTKIKSDNALTSFYKDVFPEFILSEPFLKQGKSSNDEIAEALLSKEKDSKKQNSLKIIFHPDNENTNAYGDLRVFNSSDDVREFIKSSYSQNKITSFTIYYVTPPQNTGIVIVDARYTGPIFINDINSGKTGPGRLRLKLAPGNYSVSVPIAGSEFSKPHLQNTVVSTGSLDTLLFEAGTLTVVATIHGPIFIDNKSTALSGPGNHSFTLTPGAYNIRLATYTRSVNVLPGKDSIIEFRPPPPLPQLGTIKVLSPGGEIFIDNESTHKSNPGIFTFKKPPGNHTVAIVIGNQQQSESVELARDQIVNIDFCCHLIIITTSNGDVTINGQPTIISQAGRYALDYWPGTYQVSFNSGSIIHNAAPADLKKGETETVQIGSGVVK